MGKGAKNLSRILLDTKHFTINLSEADRSSKRILMGTYEQDGNPGNGAKPIEWDVLYEKDDMMLVISHLVLDCRQINDEFTDVTWETCTLRKWMNNDFYNSAFSEDEKNHIQLVKLSNINDSPTGGGRDTQDRVFCLSVDEIECLYGLIGKSSPFPDLVSEGTRYVYGYSSVYGYSAGGDHCNWWTRTEGQWEKNYVPIDVFHGAIGFPEQVTDFYGICPAMLITK